MNKGFLIRLSICIGVFGMLMYSYIEKQNRLTRLRIALPEKQKELRALKEEIARLSYEIDHFESPAHLMELSRSPEYSHLKHPFMKDILSITEGYAADVRNEDLYLSP